MVITVLEDTIHLQFYQKGIGLDHQEKSSERLKKIVWYADAEEGKKSYQYRWWSHFTLVAVDYAGPFFTIQGRSIRRAKQYFRLFTWTPSNTFGDVIKNGFWLFKAFSRMASKRGILEIMFPNNGSNFCKTRWRIERFAESIEPRKDQGDKNNEMSSMVIQSSNSTTFWWMSWNNGQSSQ